MLMVLQRQQQEASSLSVMHNVSCMWNKECNNGLCLYETSWLHRTMLLLVLRMYRGNICCCFWWQTSQRNNLILWVPDMLAETAEIGNLSFYFPSFSSVLFFLRQR